MKTVIHYYYFNLENQCKEYDELVEKLNQTHKQLRFRAYGNKPNKQIGSESIELRTDFLFHNQWNSGTERVFDWREYVFPNKNIKAGHWLEQTQEMIDIRNNTYKCGHCGEMSREGGFCQKCIGSKYLDKGELFLLRLKPISDTSPYPVLTQQELDYLVPLYHESQGLGVNNPDAESRKMVANLIPAAVAEADLLMGEAAIKTQALNWLLDHFYKDLWNVIYYRHSKKFCFGWRTPIQNDKKKCEELQALLVDFPFDYDIK